MFSTRTRTFCACLVLIPAIVLGCAQPQAAIFPPADDKGEYFFCFWNLENLFDDHADSRANEADKKYDVWFAEHPDMLNLKLKHLCDALLKMNNGRGPDILAVAEVENERAAKLLAEALNARLSDQLLHYTSVLFKDPSGGRHIATAILTRLPVRANRTQLHGRRLRILEGHIEVNGHDLVILASHWTSRLTDKTGGQRDKYADQIYGVFKGMHKSNPKVDFLVCGDFNDPPNAPSVTHHLHAVGDPGAVLRGDGGDPLMLDLLADKDPARFGTIYYKGLSIYDHIVVAPGLLDSEGWSCIPDSIQTVNTLTRPTDRQPKPWAFGNPRERRERGYSDHYPVTVRLRVQDKQRP